MRPFPLVMIALALTLSSPSTAEPESASVRLKPLKTSVTRCGSEDYLVDGNAPGRCISQEQWCDNQCTTDYVIEAAYCSAYGFTPRAAICHGENTIQYGGCLAECRRL